ncbi:PepSY domain-containing protein [Robertkochia marina]|uniref:PepSY domain-containing protein n=1 Tax=Robertkochia marina TaxID=1227945 RepID=A0A4S3M4M6_9FLAO|nr:PepSY-associated TM helix domain-containing protein [Robertkochia marina]THD69860.1 PepSY domain-containing protein [Robertkochia marina]TRZ46795.1 PepSY domain-containing protein [Robertkochia marina]
MSLNRKKHAKILRDFRKVHRYTGALLFVFFFIIAISGTLLGLKKNTGDLLLPKTRTGTSEDLSKWLPLPVLEQNVYEYMKSQGATTNEIDRIDIRKDKGIAKFILKNDLKEIQIDGATGTVLSTGKRYSDLLEDLHDGSFVDDTFNLPNGIFKIIYTVICGIALLTFTITGFWLWYGPKHMKRAR